MSSSNPVPVAEVLLQAERAEQSGLHEQARQLLERAATSQPDNAQVVSAQGMFAFRRGDAVSARALLSRAVDLDPRSANLHFNLALTCRATRDGDAELKALDQALAIEPRHYLALLQRATYWERQGDIKQAARSYHAFVCCVPPEKSLPPALQKAVAHARLVVHRNQEQLESFVAQKMSSLRALHDARTLTRFDHCFDVLVGKRRVYVQQPTFMHFPALPAIEFYDREQFAWLPTLEAATDDIRRELMSLFDEAAPGFEPYIANAPGTPLDQWETLNHSLNWNVYYLWREGVPVAEHMKRCPRTVEVMEQIPKADVPGHAPTVFFSILRPHTRIPPHTGVTNTRLIAHLPLIIPPGCGFRVGSQTREWVSGQTWVFDDTIEHEAWNNSDQVRAVLIFDIWNPFLTSTERELVSAATAGVSEYYGTHSPARGTL